MHPRAAELIARLGMSPHPEGGHFCEVYRSASTVAPDGSRPSRAAVTTIYFLLQAGEHSALHRVLSDEIWHFYEGDVLDLVWWDQAADIAHDHRLGPVGESDGPVAVVRAGWWQAARTTGSYTLVGCTVGPGFDYADFTMMRDDAEAASDLCERRPDLEIYL
jgi:predicted cupin superfamily sugar epimerase